MVLVVVCQQNVVACQVTVQYVRAVKVTHSCCNLPGCDHNPQQVWRPQRNFASCWQPKPPLLNPILHSMHDFMVTSLSHICQITVQDAGAAQVSHACCNLSGCDDNTQQIWLSRRNLASGWQSKPSLRNSVLHGTHACRVRSQPHVCQVTVQNVCAVQVTHGCCNLLGCDNNPEQVGRSQRNFASGWQPKPNLLNAILCITSQKDFCYCIYCAIYVALVDFFWEQ